MKGDYMLNDGDAINFIYDHLADDVSKFIFAKRLEYSLTSDKENIDAIVQYEMNRYGMLDVMNRCISWIKEKGIDSVSVFGAGFAGSQIAHILKLNNIDVVRFYDNDVTKCGKEFCGAEICLPKNIIPNEFIILGVNSHVDEIILQLKEYINIDTHIFVPDRQWWIGNKQQYFDNDIVVAGENEVFVDGGSFDGQDSINFVSWCNGNYDKIYAFEPDLDNLNKIKNNTSNIKNIDLISAGLWKNKDVLYFSSGKAENSSIGNEGDIKVDVESIDNIVSGGNCTFIKMDIEGSESMALEGARNTIFLCKPKLAICVYHKPEDIVNIPIQILNMNRNYKLYLRHYSYTHTETVLYAIDVSSLS